MKKTITYLISIMLLILLVSCSTFPQFVPAPSVTTSGPRTIILNGDTFTEEDVGGLISWYCRDYINEGRILLEVGKFGDPNLEGLGFILYDGGYTGEFTLYRRTGIQHRWDWGPNGNDYAFVIKPDGTGLYYDFSTVTGGEGINASEVYQCYQR